MDLDFDASRVIEKNENANDLIKFDLFQNRMFYTKHMNLCDKIINFFSLKNLPNSHKIISIHMYNAKGNEENFDLIVILEFLNYDGDKGYFKFELKHSGSQITVHRYFVKSNEWVLFSKLDNLDNICELLKCLHNIV